MWIMLNTCFPFWGLESWLLLGRGRLHDLLFIKALDSQSLPRAKTSYTLYWIFHCWRKERLVPSLEGESIESLSRGFFRPLPVPFSPVDPVIYRVSLINFRHEHSQMWSPMGSFGACVNVCMVLGIPQICPSTRAPQNWQRCVWWLRHFGPRSWRCAEGSEVQKGSWDKLLCQLKPLSQSQWVFSLAIWPNPCRGLICLHVGPIMQWQWAEQHPLLLSPRK